MSLLAPSKNDINSKSAYLKFIDLVKIHPILYNGKELILDSQSFWQNQKLINHSWQQIASELKISGKIRLYIFNDINIQCKHGI